MSCSVSRSHSPLSTAQECEDEGCDVEIPKAKLKFYIYDEVAIHNNPNDFWVVVNDVVFNLTPMIWKRNHSMNAIMKYLLAFGGKNLSSFFHDTGYPRMEISGVTGRKIPIFPPVFEYADPDSGNDTYWWEDDTYQIGRLTRQERPIRIINTLTGKTHKMKVCEEDTIFEIQRKYRDLYNHHAGSYAWRKDYKNGRVSGTLYLTKTLTENGIFQPKNGIGPIPALWLFYTDDYTIG